MSSAHGVVVRGILRPRTTHGFPGALTKDELKGRSQGLLQRSSIDLSIRLHSVWITGIKQRAVIEDGQVKRGPDGELAQIQIATPASRRP